MSKYEFQTEVSDLLNLMINSLYSNKEIFLRELISNASDALDKLKFLTLTDDKFKNIKFDPKITIEIDKDNSKLIIGDNGIGMDEEDLKNSLGTIAKSGTKSFLESIKKSDKGDKSELIGQFGVGFYSAFMVAKKIEVLTKKAGSDKAYLWSSTGKSDFSIKEAEREDVGTTVILHLKKSEEEFLEEWRVKSIVEKYSNHIPFPIYLKKDDKEEQINKASALWRVNKSELKDEDYIEFYKTLSHDNEDPLLFIHTKAEGKIEYTTLFYIPSNPPFDLYRVDYQSGLKLYVKRVFITDDDKELLPTYLRFVRGVIDVEDIPLNVSREIIQQNIILSKVKKASVKKILSELKKLKTKDKEKYLKFWKNFGRVLKEGIMSEFENRELLLELIMFKTLNSEELIDFKTYKESMKEDQKEILYLIGEDYKMLKNSPLLEEYKEKGVDVILFDDEVDSIIVPQILEFDKTPLKAINHTEINEEEDKETKEKFAKILTKMREELKDSVKDVKITHRLKSSPACLIYDKNDPDFAMQEMLKQMGQTDLPEIKPILEINPNHEIFKKLLESGDEIKLSKYSHLILDLAKLNEGMKLQNPYEFTKTVTKLIEESL
jgi:molecular chaperone HtpG